MIDMRLEAAEKLGGALASLAGRYPRAVNEGMTRLARGVHAEAARFLNGEGGNPGAYPVPREMGTLAGLLFSMGPGQSFGDGFGRSVTTGPGEAVVGDSAEYAETIHEGLGSSAKFGPRPFLTDGFAAFDSKTGVITPIRRAIEKEMGGSGAG